MLGRKTLAEIIEQLFKRIFRKGKVDKLKRFIVIHVVVLVVLADKDEITGSNRLGHAVDKVRRTAGKR